MNQFQFEDGGRAFRCERGPSPATPGTMWWWVNVSGESQRYAAFRSEKGDTEGKVRARVIAYYEQLLADRARPPMPRATWAQRQSGAAPAAAKEPETKQS